MKIKLYRRYISLGKNTVDIGFGTICSCRHPLGSGNISPADGGVLYGRSHSFSLKDDYLHPFATGKLVTRFIFCAVVFLEINGERMKYLEIWSQKWYKKKILNIFFMNRHQPTLRANRDCTQQTQDSVNVLRRRCVEY